MGYLSHFKNRLTRNQYCFDKSHARRDRHVKATRRHKHIGYSQKKYKHGILFMRSSGGERNWEPKMPNDKTEHPISGQASSDMLDAIHAIAVAGSQASDEDALLEQATHIVGTFLNPDNFGVMLLDREKERLVLHPSYRRSNEMEHLESVPLGQGVTGRVAQSDQPIRVDDVNEDPRYIPVNPQIRSELCVPLVVNNELIGVVDAESVEPEGFSSTDEIVLVTIAAQLATAIDRLRRTAEAKQQAQQIATIYELGREVTAILRLDELLPAIVRLIIETLGLDGVQIALIEDAHLVCKASHETGKGRHRRVELPEEGSLLGDVIHTGTAETIRDPAKMIDLCGVNQENVSTEIILPLRLDSAIIGVLIIACRNPQEETICQMELLEFLADQVAVAIQNAQLFAATRQKTEELSTLYETALVTSMVLEPRQLFQQLYERIAPLLSPERFSMALCDPDTQTMDVAFLISRGEKAPQISRFQSLVEDGGVTEWVLKNRESLLVRDAHSENLPVETTVPSDVHSWLGVPLIAHQKMIGVLSVDSDQQYAFDQHHRRLLESMARQVAIALTNARLHHEALTTAERIAVLYWSSQKWISIHADAEEVYSAIHETASRLMESDAFVIALLDREQEEIYFPYLVDQDKRRSSQRIPEHQGVSGQVIATGQSRLIADWKEAPDHDDLDRFHFGDPAHIRSLIAVPLRLRGSIFGMISTQSYRPNAYTAEDQRLLEMLASDAAIALENARLFIAERQRHRELEAIRQASLHLTSSLELKPVLQAILKHTLELINADDTHIFLYDGETLSFGAARWADEARHEPFSRPREDGITYTVACSGERIVVETMSTHPLFADTDWEGALLSLPLLMDQQVIGVMNIAFTQPHRFSDNELRVLSLLADQAAIAIRNARLFTEAQERASALAEALERLQQLDEMKSQFIQNTSHELRTPITLIRGHAELLEHGSLGSLKPEQQESVNLIARRSRMLSKMLKDLRVLLNTERRKTEHTPIEMVSMLRALSKEFQIRAQETELTLDASIEAETAVVLGNEVHLNRVVDNLMDNAIKFTPAGGHIDLRFWREKNWGILEVSDTGIGIPENERQRIFERFYQVDGGMTRRYGGTGLGLALVKEIVEAHGGQVTAESILGEGSTLRVTLPLVET